MAEVSSLGVGSGLDLASLVTKLVATERAPADGRLNRIQQRAQAQLSAFGSLRGAASKLKRRAARSQRGAWRDEGDQQRA